MKLKHIHSLTHADVYNVYQGVNFGKKKLISYRSLLTTFEVTGAVVKMDSSLKSNHQINLSLSKSLMHTLDFLYIRMHLCLT